MATVRRSDPNIPLSAGNIGVDLTKGFDALERGFERRDARREQEVERERQAPIKKLQKERLEQEVESGQQDIFEKALNNAIIAEATTSQLISDNVAVGDFEGVKQKLIEQRSLFERTGQIDMLSHIDELTAMVDEGDLEGLQRDIDQNIGIAKDRNLGGFKKEELPEVVDLQNARDKADAEGRHEDAAQIDALIERKGTPPSTTVNVNTEKGFQNVFSEKFAEKLAGPEAERVDQRISLANEAVQQNVELDIAEQLVLGGVPSGTGSETILKLKSLAKTLGIPGLDDVNLGGQEILRQIQSKMALRARNPDSGLGLTGNTSNRDLEFLKAIAPGLANTPQGNLAIIEATRAKNRLVVAVQEEQFSFMLNKGIQNIKPGEIDAHFHLIEFANNFEVFTLEQRKRFEEVANIGQEQEEPTDEFEGFEIIEVK